MNPCSPLPCHSSGENINTGRKGVQKGRSQRARIRQIYCQITCFFRRLFIFSPESLIFWGLNNKVLTSTPVSNHGWNYGELPDRPTQNGYLASYIQALGRAAGTLAGESEASEFGESAGSSRPSLGLSRLPCWMTGRPPAPIPG